MIHEILVFLQKWSPHIWLFGSIFGVLMSATLFYRKLEQRIATKIIDGDVHDSAKFWLRHGTWFFIMHLSFLNVGMFAVLKVRSDWVDLMTLVTLDVVPLILVYRSYDSLRLDLQLRRNGVSKRDAS